MGQAAACHSATSCERPQPSCASECRQPDSNCNGDGAECCAAMEDQLVAAIGNAKRGGIGLTDEEMADHELLQYARRGDAKGVAEALRRGALVEARRPLAMRPREDLGEQPPMCNSLEDNECDSIGMTPLMFAAQSGGEDCVRRLLENGAHVNAVDEDLWTSLHFAAREGHLGVCFQLLDGRADPYMANCDDMTPLKLARNEVEEHRLEFRFLRQLEKVIRQRQGGTSL